MVIMMDDEDRENEGDLVYAATFSTPQLVNFMAKEARGLICTPITKELANKLELTPMVKNNISNHETAFTISIDSTTASTGYRHMKEMIVLQNWHLHLSNEMILLLLGISFLL